jgi:uncharacterized protein
VTDDSHASEVEGWRAGRYAALQSDTGWLTLAGLGWLKPGENHVGTAPEADVRLPSGPDAAGTITIADGRASATGDFTHQGQPVRDLELVSDLDGAPTMLEVGALRICVIDRGGRLAVRTWDTASERRRTFAGIDHWPVDPAWRLEARFEPTPDARISVPDVIGTVDEQISPGTVAFEVEGDRYKLQGLPGGPNGELWLVFGDATNGKETYGGGRFLYTDAPSADGSVVVDFNRSYNPPCVFSPYATCPLPWPANRLPIRVEAGERMVEGH